MVDRVEEAYRHCEALVRAHDKGYYLASLFAPAARRHYLLALYAFALEVGQVKQRVKEPMAGMIRLQWWLEAIGGLRTEEAAASPVMIALQDASRQTNVSLAPLTGAIEARQSEFEGVSVAGATAPIFVMAARFLGAEDQAISTTADNAAQAVTFAATDPQRARQAYEAFRASIDAVPANALSAFLAVALVPLRLKSPNAPQWRRQLVLLRAAWFGFPKL